MVRLTLFLGMVAGFILGLAANGATATLEILNYNARNRPFEPFFKPVCNAKLSGLIMPGDAITPGAYEVIKQQLDEFRLSPMRNAEDREHINSDEEKGYYALCLNSTGGDVREALKIGSLFEGWMMVVDAENSCLSACAILFMMADRRDHIFVRIGPGPKPGLNKAGRYLHYRGTLGFHAPRLELPDGPQTQFSRDAVSEAYSRAIKTIAKLVFGGSTLYDDCQGETDGVDFNENLSSECIADILENDSFIERQVSQAQTYGQFLPPDLLLAILSTPPSQQFRVTTIKQAMRWGIEPFGFPNPTYISERMLTVACANLVFTRCIMGGPRRQCTTLGSGRQFFRADINEIDDAYFAGLQHYFRVVKTRLWPRTPRTSSLEVQGYRLIRTFDSRDFYVTCDARLVYRDRKLSEIQLDTFNGQGPELKLGSSNFTEDDAEQLERLQAFGDVKNHLRPWKMLPANRKLVDLGYRPWEELEKGGPLLNR